MNVDSANNPLPQMKNGLLSEWVGVKCLQVIKNVSKATDCIFT